MLAGMLAGAMALSVAPILGFTGVASAQEVAEPTGPGNFCEDVPQSEPFTDVQTTDPSYAEIVCLVATEITTGVTATTYEPNSFVTRRQMALFLVRLANEADRLEIADNINELPAPADTDFSDTEDEEQFIEDAISQITQANVAEGFPDNTYRPGAPVSRRQMAAFIDRMYTFLTGAALPNSATDHFADDNADSAEAQASTNRVAEAGIFIGNEDGTFRPAQEITRRQMANVLTRTLQVLMENGEITKWASDETPGTNQTYALATGSETRGAGGAPSAANTRTCTVTGIPNGTVVDAVLLQTEDVNVVNGATVFQDNTPADNLADEDAIGAAIVNINGANVGPAQRVNDINAAIGVIQVTIYGAASDDVTLVVHTDAAGLTANRLDLAVPGAANSNAKAPREAFGTGCRTIFANEAASGAFSTTVASVAKDQDLFTGANTFSYFYDANDVFTIGGVQVTMAAFEAALSPADGIAGNYNAAPEFPSTFNLTDSAPLAPGSVSPTVSGTSVTLTFPESTTTTADAYNVYRVIRPPSGTCPDFNTAAGRTAFGAMAGTVTDPNPSTQGAGNLTFANTGLQPATAYCFAVTSVDDGDESNTGALTTATTGTVADTGAPRITDVRAADAGTIGLVDAGDTHQFIFSEPMSTSVDADGELYRIQDTDGTVAEIRCGAAGNAACTLQGAGTFNGTLYPANQVLRVVIDDLVTPLAGFLGSNPGVQYPATITNVSAGWDDATGNQLDLAGSPDKTVDVAAITPAPGGGGDAVAPAMTAAVGDESANTVTITYDEAVLCDNSAAAAAQYNFDDSDNTNAVPTGILCNGTATVVLTFAAGVVQVADTTPQVQYADENAAAVDANDVRDTAGNQAVAQTQAATVGA